jgi:hypothetical protein
VVNPRAACPNALRGEWLAIAGGWEYFDYTGFSQSVMESHPVTMKGGLTLELTGWEVRVYNSTNSDLEGRAWVSCVPNADYQP